MVRADAQTAVDKITDKLPQQPPYPDCLGVPHEAARLILGENIFAKMMADRIRCHGPCNGYVYPWNVVDYLDDATKL